MPAMPGVDHLPVDHKLSRVYRFGGGLTGLVLLTFGALGFFNQLDFFSTDGRMVAGLSSNGALSTISVVFGLILIGAAVVGGNTSSTVNIVVGSLFLLSGLVNLCVMRTDLNVLAFQMPNVIFSFVVGMIVLTFGLYGRASGNLPQDNPYRQARHVGESDPTGPAQADVEGSGPGEAGRREIGSQVRR